MTKNEISESLTFHGIKKSKVETDLGMPQNSLAGILKNDKELPKKWADVLIKYIEDLDKPKVQETTNVHESRTEEVIVHELATETVILAPVMEITVNVPQKEEKPLIGDANAKFDQLFKEFNKLIENTPKPKDIEQKMKYISEKAKNSNLTPRQVDAIVDRCRYYLNGQYKLNELS